MDMKKRSGVERERVKDPVTGRSIWRLTAVSGAHDIQPYYDIDSWSPDRSKIIFSSAEEGTMRDGSIGGSQAMLSDEGHIYTLDVKTGEIKWLIGNQPYDSHTGCYPIWHPSGRWMLFGSGLRGEDNLHMIVIDLATMKSELFKGLRPRQVSPDGKSVLCLCDEGVSLFDFENKTSKIILKFSDCVKLIPEKNPPEGAAWAVQNLKYNQDGTKFIMRFSSIPVTVKHLMTANIDGTGLLRLDTPSYKWHHHSWLPDRQNILFGDRDANGTPHLYQIGSDNRNLKMVSAHKLAGHPIASPDGKKIVTDDYSNDKKDCGIMLLDLETDRLEKLASFTVNFKRSNAHPVWSHDGTQILYHSDHTGFSNLYLIDL